MATLFARLSSLLKLTWNRECEKKVLSSHAKFDAEDLVDISSKFTGYINNVLVYVKIPNIVCFYIASQFQSHVQMKHCLQLRQVYPLNKVC